MTEHQETYDHQADVLLFVDVETSGLDPDRDVITEIAWIRRQLVDHGETVDGRPITSGEDSSARVHHPIHDPSLVPSHVADLTDYSRRIHPAEKDTWELIIALLERHGRIDGATLVGANPAFDAAFLWRQLRRHGYSEPPWHHRLVDVEVLAMAAAATKIELDAHIEHGYTACGTGARLYIPGPFSRMETPRCPDCCDVLGYPQGDGSPKNDEEIRPLVRQRLSDLDALTARQTERGGVVVERWKADRD